LQEWAINLAREPLSEARV